MMKKVFFTIAIVAVITTMVSCGSKDHSGGFDYHEGFRDISNPEVDNANKYVKGHYLLRDGENKQYVAFTIQNDGTQKKLKEWQGK